MYIKIHAKILFSENLKAKWKKIGLVSLNLNKIFDKLLKCANSISNQLKTLPNKINLNFSLLDSFSLNDTKLRKVNKLLVSALNEILNLFNSMQQYMARLTTIIEFTHAELITAWKKFKLIKKIFNTRKKCMKSKRIALEKKFVFFTQKVLDITQAAEVKTKTKKKCKQPRKHTIDEILNKEEAETLENESSSSDSDCIVVAKRT